MQAVILAGGKGTRLRPFTNVIPKPLMPVGNQPIIEILIRQLASAGFTELFVAVGYLHHLIQAFLGDGERFGLKIRYSLEDRPLGTAGPLKAIIQDLDETFLVLNGDLLTTLDFRKMYRTHCENGYDATIATFNREQKIDFGVLEVDDAGKLQKYVEKPTYNFRVSMGINAFRKDAVQNILERSDSLDIPGLMMEMMDRKAIINCYHEDCLWLDIGRADDFDRAQDLFEKNKNIFLVNNKA
ncbi:MAG: NTP transferase domain-containing protein [Bdellovibrionales bacterium]|nr:NTP transferase domain-containing protein [Bdellovibrionales bacterium]